MQLPSSRRLFCSLVMALAWVGSSSVVNALAFNFNPAAGTSATAIAGFQAAGARWSGLFSDPVTVNIDINFTALGSGILGQAGSTRGTLSYGGFKSALALDQHSSDDATAVSYLPGSSVPIFINRTSDNPNGSGSATAYLDNDGSPNNNTIRMTTANAKALGIYSSTASDARISFSTAFTWDFDPTDGITSGSYDFVGVATHEIGHALGFISGVDVLDGNSPPPNTFNSNDFTYVSPLDLFRYSTASTAVGAIDWTADNREKYFSIDGGLTNAGATFSNGVRFGDGRQASHWKDDLYLGIMDPTSARGELLAISTNDIRAFDVIGWDRADAQGVPDTTATLALLGLGLALVGSLRRQTSSQS